MDKIEYYFDKAPRVSSYRQHASIFGLRNAVIIHHFMFWIKKNRENIF